MISLRPTPTKTAWTIVAVGLCLLAALFWFSTTSTMAARIAALETVEPYAFAVHQQLAYNFADSGEFFQTIHRGYGDEWAWSGHRAATLPINAWFYGLSPSPSGLSTILITWLLLGAIPAAGLGYSAAKHPVGALVGGGLYLTTPTVWALALQDYQDLVLALPALLTALWAMKAKHVGWVVAGALLGCLPREECLPLVLACAVVAVPVRVHKTGWQSFDGRRWLRNIAVTGAVVAAYAAFLAAHHSQTPVQHDMPLVGALRELVAGSMPGLAFWDSFYLLLLAPFGVVLLLLAPEVGALGALLVVFHLTVARHHGVDRAWSGHIHHVAPAVAFLTAATAIGAGRLLRFVGATPISSVRRVTRWGLCLALVAYSTFWTVRWAQARNLRVTLTSLAPAWEHPAWSLVRLLPQEAIPIVPNNVSIAVANRTESYTYRESLLEKAPDRGMGAGTHLIVDLAHPSVVEWGLSMPGATVLETAPPFQLLGWDAGAKDPTLPRDPDLGLPRPGDSSATRDRLYPGLSQEANTPDW